MQRPGLELGSITFVNGVGDNSTLSEEHVEELVAVKSYLNYLQNWYGPPSVAGSVNIANTTREDFLFFIDQHSDQNLEDNPILPDDDLMLRAHALRTGTNINNNNKQFPEDRTSRSPTTTPPRHVNYLLSRFNKEKRPLSDYAQHLKSIKEWPEFDRQLNALAHTHGVDKVLDESYSTTPGSDEEEVFDKMKDHMSWCSSNLSRRQRGCVLSRNTRMIGMLNPYTRNYVSTTLGKPHKWQSAISMRWKLESSME